MTYQVKLEKFAGPLELLLQLIENQELVITEVSLAMVTDQFLAYVNNNPQLPPAVIADFLVVAAKLLIIKSRALMVATEIEPDVETQELEHQLKIYREYYLAAQVIRHSLLKRHFAYGRPKPAFAFVPKFSPPLGLNIATLPEIFGLVIDRLTPLIKLPEISLRRVVTLTEKIDRIRVMILSTLRFGFKQLLQQGDRTELIVSFLAVLELVKQRTIDVSQTSRFSEIEIERIVE